MKKIILAAILFSSILTACSRAESSSNTNAYSKQSYESAANSAVAPSADKTGSGGGGGRNAPVAQVSLNQTEQTPSALSAVERKIIRNADLQLEADKPEDAQIKISQIAETKGGFVVETQSSASDVKAATRDTVTMTVRVPAAKFDEALSEIRATASRVIEETVKGEDVTEEFIDVEARLKTQKALEAQFLEIMKQAKSVEDALNVQTEIATVRGEIEKVEGRKRFLENQASLSAIKIKLQTPTAFSANSSGFFYQLREAFGDGFDAALTFLLFLVKILIALIPFFLLIVLPIYFVIRYFLRKNRKQKLADEIVREEIKNER
ncbi:MAG: DUF4349 domain-containing protein [Acidobacteriota bacterium]|nr:DUF4349 domain-containing protein [Acidobacteriota bacterium]